MLFRVLLILTFALSWTAPLTAGLQLSQRTVGLDRKTEILSTFPFLSAVEAALSPDETFEFSILRLGKDDDGATQFYQERLVLGATSDPPLLQAWPPGTLEWFSYGELDTIPANALARDAETAYGFWAPLMPEVSVQYRGPIEIEDPELSEGIDLFLDGNTEVIFGTGPRELAEPYFCGSGEVAATAGATTMGRHFRNGIEYRTISESTYWVRRGNDCLSAATLQAVLSHETGHTLGIRHPCGDHDLPPCDRETTEGQAVMHPNVPNGALPRQWDQEQMALRYGASTALPECPPAVSFRDVPLEVAVAWKRLDGTTGCAATVDSNIADNSANLYFFQPENWEVTLKGLDSCNGNGHTWFFAAGLTNLQTEITVKATNRSTFKKYYTNPREPFQPILDVTAFRNCEPGN